MHKDKTPIISTVELISILLLSTSFLVLINLDIFINFLLKKDTESLNYFNERLSSFLLGPLNTVSERMLSPSIATFILWAILGMVCFTIVYFFKDVGAEISDTVKVSSKYVHPKDQKKSTYRRLLFANIILLLVSIIVCILIVSVTFKFLVPYSSTNILLALYESSSLIQTLSYIFLAFTALTLIPISILVMLRTYHYIRTKISI